MITNISIHNVVLLTLSPIEEYDHDDPGRKFYSRTLIVTNSDGASQSIPFFASTREGLALLEQISEAK